MTERAHPQSTDAPMIDFELDGQPVAVPDTGDTLLGVLRGPLGVTSVKDGCSPQGQCGCCTVLVDGKPRVACVTPARRIRGRSVTTIDGLADDRREAWGNRFCESGGSQCGFCTPGIVMRLEALEQKGVANDDLDSVRQALLAHLCRCTGWQTILEAWEHDGAPQPGRDLEAAARRASIESGIPQSVSADVALGAGGFAADSAPSDALIAVPDGDGGWVVGENLQAAQAAAGKVQGRRTTAEHTWPIELPDDNGTPWAATLQTTWVEPGYLETDASWCAPGGEPSSPLANAGAFGAKAASPVVEASRALANAHGKPVLALFSREDGVRMGPKRPPLAAGMRADGSATLRIAATPGLDEVIEALPPEITVEVVEIPGPATSLDIRAAVWAEIVALRAAASGSVSPVVAPNGAQATAVMVDGQIKVTVACGDILDPVVLRSYCIGAAHMAYSWVTSEALTVDGDGVIHDLTMRSFGITRAVDMPLVEVELIEGTGPAVNGSDAVFAAVAAAVWAVSGFSGRWPLGQLA